MAGNPRKFSEKIALHNQKQAEGTAAFDEIMKSVSEVNKVTGVGVPTSPKPIKQTQQTLLPITNSSMNCRSLPNVHAISSHHDKNAAGTHFNQKLPSPRSSRGNSIGPVKTQRSRTDHSPYSSHSYVSPSSSMIGNMTMTNSSGTNLCSSAMYQNSSYLIPPNNDATWRRANSDSALHSLNSLIIPSVVPDSSEESSNNSNDPRDNYAYLCHSPKHGDMSGMIPSTVGDGPSLLEILPPAVSSGSLPDLTTFTFTPPLQQPIDPDDSQLNSNSPYSTSPLSMTYSPTGGSPNPHSNNLQQQQQQHALNNQRSPHGHPLQHMPQYQQQQNSQQQQQQQQLQQSPHHQQNNQQQHQNILDNSIVVNSAFTSFTSDPNMLTAYRCPQRPSPQNSPSPFRSPSPLDGQLSAPSSPAASSQIQNSVEALYNSQQANALQQHFEQISMGSPAPHRNSSNWQGGGMMNNSPYFYNTGQAQVDNQSGPTAGVTMQQSPQHYQPQTPQTPSSIPDIIFTDFDVRTSESFDEDILATEAAAQALREGLGPLDIDGFNILDNADPDLVIDPQAEDSFRLDRL